jgi:tetratricopeptide (TPR) repeat protein
MKARTPAIKLIAGALLLLGISYPGNAQSGAPGPLPGTDNATGGAHNNRRGTIQVYVRTEDGEPLSATPDLTILAPSDNVVVPQMQKAPGDLWIFTDAEINATYELQVRAPGYRTELRAVRVPDSADASASFIVFMRSPKDELAFHAPTGRFVLEPQAEKEAQKGAADLDSGRVGSAQKHLNKALRMAPENPYLNYLMGMRFLLNGDMGAAKPYLEKSVSADASQVPALVALGTLRFRQADYAGAIQVLAPAAQLDSSKWNVHSMLAGSYLKQKEFQQARDQAQQSLALGGAQAGRDELVLGEALAALGQREQAVAALKAFLKQYPHDGNVTAVRGWLPELEKPQPVKSTQTPFGESFVAATPVDLPPKKNWAPPDIDATKPFVISEAACSLPKVLDAAQKDAVQFVNELQQFSATEDYQSVEIKRNEQLEKPQTLEYNYLVLIEELRPGLFHVEESRQAKQGTRDTPELLADVGAPGLALVFHPTFHDDFDWRCEGLGEWKGIPAWVIHFEQNKDRPTSRLAGYSTPSQLYLLPLKGRAWISQTGGQVVHLDTDLVHPMAQIGLTREHFSIDYKPVSFQTHKVQLWLPENVDVYYQFKGHFLHHYHHYTNFKLFWVGATQKISKPKETNPQH